MNEAASSLNAKDLATNIAMNMLKQVRKEVVGSLGQLIVAWAREHGATIKDEASALSILQSKIPDPMNWPAIEVTPSTKLVTNNETPKQTRPRAAPSANAGKKALTDFKKVEVSDGVKAPTCPILKKTGDKAPCGKTCKYALDEHDPKEDPMCRLLTCNHCFCGTHIKSVASDETAAYDNLSKASNNNGKPVTVSGSAGGQETQIGSKIMGALTENEGKSIGAGVMEKLMNKVKANNATGGNWNMPNKE